MVAWRQASGYLGNGASRYGKHEFLMSGPDALKPAALPDAEPGAYVIVGHRADGKARSTVLLLVSRLACLAKGPATRCWSGR